MQFSNSVLLSVLVAWASAAPINLKDDTTASADDQLFSVQTVPNSVATATDSYATISLPFSLTEGSYATGSVGNDTLDDEFDQIIVQDYDPDYVAYPEPGCDPSNPTYGRCDMVPHAYVPNRAHNITTISSILKRGESTDSSPSATDIADVATITGASNYTLTDNDAASNFDFSQGTGNFTDSDNDALPGNYTFADNDASNLTFANADLTNGTIGGADNDVASDPKPGYVNLKLDRSHGGYMTQIKVGGKKLKVYVDTASGETVLPQKKGFHNLFHKSYKPTKKYTKSYDRPTQISLAPDGSNPIPIAPGMDFIQAGASTVYADIALADKNQLKYGVLGLGPQVYVNVTENDDGTKEDSPNFGRYLTQLQSAGYIKSLSYSISLNANDGLLYLGGVDDTKYNGEFTYLPYSTQANSGDDHVTVGVSQFTHSLNVLTSQTYPAVIATKSDRLGLPSEVYQNLKKEASSYFATNINCHATGPDFVFKVGDLQVNVPFQNLVLRTEKNPFKCVFGVVDSGSEYVLGHTSLRSTYVNVDIDNQRIGFAKAVYSKQKQVSAA